MESDGKFEGRQILSEVNESNNLVGKELLIR